MSARSPPRLVYDDDCGFCTWCADYADRRGTFEIVGFSELTADQRARLPADYEDCVYLLTDDEVYSCGAAVEETLARLNAPERGTVALFRSLPGHDRARDALYHWGAERRGVWGRALSR